MNTLSLFIPVQYPQTSGDLSLVFRQLQSILRVRHPEGGCSGGYVDFLDACEDCDILSEESQMMLIEEVVLEGGLPCSCAILRHGTDKVMIQHREDSQLMGLCPQ